MSPPPVFEYRAQRRVEFSHTDMAGIVHFSRFFTYMESVEHEFLRHLGTSVSFEIDGRAAGWPRLAASCEYRSPAHFEDVLDIHLRILRKGSRSLSYGFVFKVGERLVAEGSLSAACCFFDGPQGLEATPIPESLAALLAEAPRGVAPVDREPSEDKRERREEKR